ncbi:MAG: phosphate acyltransferase PlsX [Synergistales bacterium]|nr:phosphate acyltransferase PlsX [Synergistales bacterium]
MILALDAMGGDHAPVETCKGAINACARHSDLEIILVGDQDLVRKEIEAASSDIRSRLHIYHAQETIGMEEMPAVAIRKKRHSSLRLAMQMVHSGDAQGCVSAGNTGAIVAGGVLVVGRISGIDRPALGVALPTPNRVTFLLDVGATVRCKPVNLYQFALMGDFYSRHILGVSNPEISLLSNGAEEIKGDEVVAAARTMIRNSNVNYRGFIEGDDIPYGKTDVVVCDGFTGNVVLKLAEGLGQAIYSMVREEIGHRFLPKVGVMFLIPMLKDLRKRLDYEKHGGTPLLGVNGAVIKAHGRSKAPAVTSALCVARDFVRQRGVELIKGELEQGGGV